MEKLIFKIEDYDAPLDLILQLIGKNKLDILNIDISSLLSQYIEQIQLWQQSSLDVTSEFLEMASRLVYIKTVSLLPRREDEHERLKAELTGQLIEYRLCKVAAVQLGYWDISRDIFVREQMNVEIDNTYTNRHSANILLEALNDALGRELRRQPPPRQAFEKIVETHIVSVTSRIFAVLKILRKNGHADWQTLFDANLGKSNIIATFLAILDLIKSKKISVKANGIVLFENLQLKI